MFAVKTTGISREAYQNTIAKLIQDGDYPADDSVLHLAVEDKDDKLLVIDVWEDEDDADDFYDAFKDAAENFTSKDDNVKMKKMSLVSLSSEENDLLYYEMPAYDDVTGEGTLSYVADLYDTTVDDLVDLNDIEDPDDVYEGQIIRVS